MYNSKFHIVVFFVAVVLISCEPTKQNSNGKLKVVSTTGMIYDALINITQGKVEAQALMGPGVDPHLYKATQGDIAKLQQADLVLYNGLHLEGKMAELFEKLGRTRSVRAVSASIPDSLLRESETYANTFDPHIWFDVQLWKYAVQELADQLILIDSSHATFYSDNTRAYLQSLDSLHLAVSNAVQTIPVEQRLLVTAHDAFGYFGDAYQIEVKGLQGISTLSEPGLKDITNLVTLLVDRNIKAVFVETSVSEKSINAVIEGCSERGHTVVIGGSLYSDAMGALGTEEGQYLGMVNANVSKIVNALK